MGSILSGIITSKVRIRILMRLFFNPQQSAYLRELADEFNVSPSQVGEELRLLTKAEVLDCKKKGRQILYHANQKHPLFSELHSMVKKSMGMDRILESILERLGELKEAYIIDDYAAGKDTGLIDLLLIGNIDETNLIDLVAKTEKYIGRKIRTLVLPPEEFSTLYPMLAQKPMLLLWRQEVETACLQETTKSRTEQN